MQGDCLERMKEIESRSIDLIVIDPPYNIGKSKEWDRWKKQSDYIDWLGMVFLECQRALKDNGSFYFFHNDFLQIVKLQELISQKTKFVFKQFIVWNKRFEKAKNKGFFDGFVEVEVLRNYQKMAEYCLFYTFQSDYLGYDDSSMFENIRSYFRGERQKIKSYKIKEINQILGFKTNGGSFASDVLNPDKKSWKFPSKHIYERFSQLGICLKSYEELKEEYDKLRDKYKSERYTFNNGKTHHSVWDYQTASKNGHITPKPVDLIENIIRHSSSKGDVVLDCFMGSGTTGVACKNLNRNFIGIELDENYFDTAKERIENTLPPPKTFN